MWLHPQHSDFPVLTQIITSYCHQHFSDTYQCPVWDGAWVRLLIGKGWCSLFSFSIVRRRMDTGGNSGILDWVRALWHSSLSVHFLFTQIIKCFYISYSRINKSMSSFYQKMEIWIKELKLCLPKWHAGFKQQIRKVGKLHSWTLRLKGKCRQWINCPASSWFPQSSFSPITW